jgi:hypothetical protein
MAKGGKRSGAGRKAKPKLPFAAKAQAARVLDHLGTEYEGGVHLTKQKLASEDELWLTLLTAQDLRIRLDALKYLVDRREGKPWQTFKHGGDPDGEPVRLVLEDVAK